MKITKVENGYCVCNKSVTQNIYRVFKNFKELVEYLEEEFNEPDFTGGLK